MLQANNMFKTMYQARIWNTPSPKEEKILALEVQIQTAEGEKEAQTVQQERQREGGIQEKKKQKEKGSNKVDEGSPSNMAAQVQFALAPVLANDSIILCPTGRSQALPSQDQSTHR